MSSLGFLNRFLRAAWDRAEHILGIPLMYDAVPKSNAAAGKALELDPSLARPHAALASNKSRYDFDIAAAEVEYRKALELDPSDATARVPAVGGENPVGIGQAGVGERISGILVDRLIEI